jgi:CelD/BcsL family acetyltransferase involved in cellulose biosynthesis
MRVRVFRDEEGRLVGVAPLMLSESPRYGPRLRCMRYFGADRNLTEVRGPLSAPEREAEVHEAIVSGLMAREREWDVFIADGVRVGGALPAVINCYGSPHWLHEVPSLTLDLPGTWDAFRSSRSRNIKESLRKCTNSLKRDGLVPEFGLIREGPEVDAILTAFFALHAARATRTGTVPHANAFRTGRAQAFMREICRRFSAVDGLRIFTMRLRGELVAVRVAFRTRKSLYLYYSGYAAEYGKYSVMTSLVAEAIKHAIATGCVEVNLSTGFDVSKMRWSPNTTVYRQGLVASRMPRARLATAGYRHLHDLRARASRWAEASHRALGNWLPGGPRVDTSP